MPGHKNAEISKVGRAIFTERANDLGWRFYEEDPSPTGYYVNINGNRIPCKVYTKRHEEQGIYRITGRNRKEVLEFLELQQKHNCEIMIFFVDAALGCCYGDTLNKMLMQREWGNQMFPWIRDTHKGKIYFFSVELLPTVFELTREQKKELSELIADNKSDKYQQKLF
jgi:hypothetical protein